MIAVRTARPADADQLSRIDLATWTPAVSPAPPPSPIDYLFFGPGVDPADVLTAEEDGVIAGWVRLGRPTSLAAHAHVLEIRGLGVHPDRRSRGIGRSLVEAAIQEARRRGARKLALRVLGPNLAARGLYERCGFVVEGVLREEFLLDGSYVDDVLMARHLTS